MDRYARAFAGVALASLVVIALLHFLALIGVSSTWGAMVALSFFGWGTGMIFAISYHVMPVFLARDFPPDTPLRGHLILFALGTLCLPVALLTRHHPLAVPLAYALHGVSGFWFFYNIMLLVRRGIPRALGVPPVPFAEQRSVDRAAIFATRLAPFSLILSPLLSGAMYARWIPGGWHLAGEHILVLGWLLPMVMGVAYHILPRFSQTPVRNSRLAQGQIALHMVALPLVAIGLGAAIAPLFTIGAALGGTSILLFLWNILPALTAFRPQTFVSQAIPIREVLS